MTWNSKEPTEFQVTKGLEEKAPLVASPEGDAELKDIALGGLRKASRFWKKAPAGR
jgi:hypothetical protein